MVPMPICMLMYVIVNLCILHLLHEGVYIQLKECMSHIGMFVYLCVCVFVCLYICDFVYEHMHSYISLLKLKYRYLLVIIVVYL